MKKIIYKFADGTQKEVEVTDEFYAQYQKIEKDEKNKNRAETRRHSSLSHIQDNGFEPALEGLSLEEILVKEEQLEVLRKAMETLTDEQKDLVNKVYFESKSISCIAKEEGVSVVAVFYRLEKIHNKLKKFFI